MEEAQKRLGQAQEHLQMAQVEQQQATQEVIGWQMAFQAEMKRSGTPLPTDAKNSMIAGAVPSVMTDQHSSNPNRNGTQRQWVIVPPTKADESKTQTVRDLIAQHPAGITPSELWNQLAGRIAHRPYLYSILKRLKDKEEVVVRRGKYLLKAKPPQEGAKQESLL
jgi:hypothetical protein